MKRLVDAAVDFMVKRPRVSYKPLHVGTAILTGASLALGLIPLVLVVAGTYVDAAFHFGQLLQRGPSHLLAIVCFGIGVPWLASSIYWQHRRGDGTPFPLLPTRKLLTDGPYRHCRNPMALGAVFWLAGWAFFANSPTAIYGGVGVFSVAIFSYHKIIEERELEGRFGECYRRYKETTPFLLPLGRMARK
jgi:protein-S-isoprenylcysteine O-methyltransferase Ste14